MSENPHGGPRYFILFIDDFARFTAVKFLERKSEALEAFKEFKMK
jgi:hypothetical protein